ncbi:MAG: hypothetical protein AAF204_00020 [Pseudomonadota bacterium]
MLSFIRGVASTTALFKNAPIANIAITLPTHFSWNPSFEIYQNGTTNYDPQSDKPSGTEKWIDPINGSDSNDGNSRASAYRSLSQAESAGANVFNITAGVIDSGQIFAGFNGFNPASDTALVAVDGPGSVIMFQGRKGDYYSWAQQSSPNTNVYATTRNAVANIVDRTHSRAGEMLVDGVSETPIPYTEQTSIADVQANPGSWVEISGTLYIHTHDSRSPDADIYVMLNVDTIDCASDITLYGEGIEFWGYRPLRHILSATNSAQSIFKSCGFRYSPIANGVDMRDVSEARFIDCAATDNYADGFGYSIDNSHATIMQALEQNCFSARNGWNNTNNTSNGSSAHDGVTLIRAGGIYKENYGPNVVDVLGAQSFNVNLDAHDSNGTGSGDCNYQAGQFNGTQSAIMYLQNCSSSGSTYDRYRFSGGTIVDLVQNPGPLSDVGIILDADDAEYAGRADLLYWLDPADTNTITDSAGAVSAITEKSASRITLSQGATGAGPTTDTRNINGLNVLDMDGGDYMSFGVSDFEGVSLFAGTGRAWTVFFVIEADANGYFLAKAGANGAVRQFGLLMSSGNLLSLLRGTTTNVQTGWDGSAAIVALRWDGSTYQYFFNDSAAVTGNVGSAAEETSENFLLGARTSAAPGFRLDGRVGPQLIYGRALSDNEVGEVRDALNADYNVF